MGVLWPLWGGGCSQAPVDPVRRPRSPGRPPRLWASHGPMGLLRKRQAPGGLWLAIASQPSGDINRSRAAGRVRAAMGARLLGAVLGLVLVQVQVAVQDLDLQKVASRPRPGEGEGRGLCRPSPG